MHTEKRRVVLDTNVVISAIVSIHGTPAAIVKRLVAKDFENYVSNDIIQEIKQVLQRPAIRKHSPDEYRDFFLENFLAYSVLISPTFNEKASFDPDDDKIINCALSANADIVSGDSHLISLKKYKTARILTPSQFLSELK